STTAGAGSFSVVTGPSTASSLVHFTVGGGDVYVLSASGEVFSSNTGAGGTWQPRGNVAATVFAIALKRDYDVIVGDAGAIFFRGAGEAGFNSATPTSAVLYNVLDIHY